MNSRLDVSKILPEEVYQPLLALGLPPTVTLEQFTRLYRGPLADILVFLSESVLGKMDVMKARGDIHGMKVVGNDAAKPHRIKAFRSEDRSRFRLTGAKKSYALCQKELDELLVASEETQLKISNLRNQLKDTRNTAFLLTLLEKKELTRMKRIEEITTLLRRLKEALDQRQSSQLSVSVPPEIDRKEILRRRMTHSRDALTNTEAYYVALSRVTLSETPWRNQDYIPRLKTVMQKHLSSRDAQIEATVANIVRWARTCAHEKAKYHSALRNADMVSDAELDRTEFCVRNYEAMLQGLCDHSASLLFAINPHIQYVTAFQLSTIQVLAESLGDKAYPRGYLDDQRRLLVEQVPSDSVTHKDVSFVQSAKQTLKASQAVCVPKLVQDLERLILSIDKRRRISALAPSLPLSMENHKGSLSRHRADSQKIEASTIKLLKRKLDKANMGAGLVKDVEVLVDEAKFIIGRSK
ncbi:uncharacterized protein EV420DRAFT_1648930 [Desarmillaria tabescens]|uniref:Uncharacterized protein n=1 Tax=Armillaria tabescens TaxID=1929756 RepID=A0AA39JL53_ARMTA|nr:uncharacterized protein EV420DRAFT_1648930 [Desarmillaria tabescens]KAK0444237.1 hypothetical protein EV420DRAFT_1648930 [Desarmillaria tabescens]